MCAAQIKQKLILTDENFAIKVFMVPVRFYAVSEVLRPGAFGLDR